jgi:hypothetical protein
VGIFRAEIEYSGEALIGRIGAGGAGGVIGSARGEIPLGYNAGGTGPSKFGVQTGTRVQKGRVLDEARRDA